MRHASGALGPRGVADRSPRLRCVAMAMAGGAGCHAASGFGHGPGHLRGSVR